MFTFQLIALLSLLPSIALAQRRCGTTISAEDKAAWKADYAASLPLTGSLATAATGTNITVPLYWHVIHNETTGNVPDSQIEANIKVLNDGFNSTGFQFELKCIDRTLQNDWFQNSDLGNRPQTEMKRFLHQGGDGDLNVYTVAFENIGTLGYATFPYYQAGFRDGVVIRYTTLPGGTEDSFNLGKILTHETGHWTGLYHTFEGGCDGDGDEVDDTPAEKDAAFGCQNGRDSCPAAGLDPIHNFMDYSDDVCINEFTSGQVQRLKDQMAIYRGY